MARFFAQKLAFNHSSWAQLQCGSKWTCVWEWCILCQGWVDKRGEWYKYNSGVLQTRVFPLPDSLLRDMHEADPIDGGILNSIPTQPWLLLN
jgi:hypothetical protein